MGGKAERPEWIARLRQLRARYRREQAAAAARRVAALRAIQTSMQDPLDLARVEQPARQLNVSPTALSPNGRSAPPLAVS